MEQISEPKPVPLYVIELSKNMCRLLAYAYAGEEGQVSTVSPETLAEDLVGMMACSRGLFAPMELRVVTGDLLEQVFEPFSLEENKAILVRKSRSQIIPPNAVDIKQLLKTAGIRVN